MFDKLVGDGFHPEAITVNEHVFQFYAIALK
jgi:hypothetical protein